MRIALVLNNLSGGGGERAHVMLANGLAAIGHDVELIVINCSGPCRALLDPEVSVTDLGVGRAAFALPRLINALRGSRADIVVSALVIANVLTALAGMVLRHLPMVAIEHGDMNEAYHTDRKALAPRFGYLTASSLYKRFARIYCVDQSSAASVAAFTHRLDLPLRVMPNAVIGLDAEARLAAVDAHPWLCGDVPVFLNVGRLADQKNQSLLLRAFAELRRDQPARLIILGDGPLRSALEGERKELGLDQHVDMPGFHDPFPFLQAASGFVLSSRWEALPTVVIEAMYCGCPIAVTKASMGTLDLVGFGRYGQIVEDATVPALADTMRKLLSTPIDRKALRARGASFRQDLVASRYAEDFKALLTDVLP